MQMRNTLCMCLSVPKRETNWSTWVHLFLAVICEIQFPVSKEELHGNYGKHLHLVIIINTVMSFRGLYLSEIHPMTHAMQHMQCNKLNPRWWEFKTARPCIQSSMEHFNTSIWITVFSVMFSKLCYPDLWDSRVSVARIRAVSLHSN